MSDSHEFLKKQKDEIVANQKQFPGERKAILEVLHYGENYGYGNLISHLGRAWANMLKEKYGMSEESAAQAATMPPMQDGFDPFNVFKEP